jgi:hypothetical protein
LTNEERVKLKNENSKKCSERIKSSQNNTTKKTKDNEKIFKNEKYALEMMNKKFTFREVFLCDQNEKKFANFAKIHSINPGICGYLSIAIAFELLNLPLDSSKTLKEASSIIDGFQCDFESKMVELVEYFKKRRELYIKSNTDLFENQSEIERFLSQELANYEISDYLQEKNLKIHFIRNVLETKYLEFEEKQRSLEEMKFTNEICFVHDGNDQQFKTFKEWKKQKSKEQMICITNFGDHTGVVLFLKDGMILLNTLQTKYVTSSISMFIFEFFKI